MIYMVFFLVFLLSEFIILDFLIRKYYRENFDLWIKEGKPFGYFWVPQESKGLFLPKVRSQIARNRISTAWLLSTPLWMKYDQKALKLLRIGRLIFIAAIICWSLSLSEIFRKVASR